jgi:EmrB/QacA subfamily drug resistance transporter
VAGVLHRRFGHHNALYISRLSSAVNRTSIRRVRPLACSTIRGNLPLVKALKKGTDDMIETHSRKWLALALLSVVQFMVVLDIAIVNVALPSIQVDLGFSQENLQWVISAYALVFGGFLLLGGRAADLLGRRRIFLVGIVVFTVSSLLAGLAWSEASLIAARAFQGLGAAVITPAALSILSTTFAEGRDRNIALGVWGAVGGFGAAAGVLMGGVLTDLLSWEWIFFVNIPVGVTAFILAPILLKESRDASVKSFDALGAVLVTAGLSLSVYAITQAAQDGWTSAKTLSIFAVSAVLLAGFIGWELRHSEPLMRLGILRTKTVSGANVAGFILGTATFSLFLMLTLYMQQVLGYSPLKTGIAYLAVAGTAIFTSAIAAQLVTRIGVKPALVIGMVSLTAGLLYFTQVSVGGSYLADLLPGFLLIAVGLGFSFVPISIAALAGIEPHEAGLASGLINTTQQIGGALGIAALSTIATTRTDDAVAGGSSHASALVSGFHGAFWAGVIIAAVGIVAALTLIRRDELAQGAEPVEAEPVLDLAA